GRQDRRLEPHARTIDELADAVAAALARQGDGPLALFGHSMGALVAFEVARRVGDRAGDMFVSGRRAPSCTGPESVRSQGTDAQVRGAVAALGGTDPRVLADDDLRELVLPALRADYRALDVYVYRPAALLRCPVTALIGDADPVTSIEQVQAWKHVTTGPFALREYHGGHFYLTRYQAQIAAQILRGLRVHA